MSHSNMSEPRMYGNTSCAPESVYARPLMNCDVRPSAIPSLMSIQTTPPVSSNDIKSLTNNGNRRSVPDPVAATIPSLMSIETRPPWETRLPHNNETTSMTSVAHLQRTIAAQNDQINVLISERNWLEQENNSKRVTLIRLKQKIAEYERYLHHREAAMAIELDKVRQQSKEREQQIQKRQNKKMQGMIARCRHWERAYYKKEEEVISMKSGHVVNMVRLYGGYIDCTDTLQQPITKLSWRVRIPARAAESKGRTMGRLALPAPEFATVLPAHATGEINFDPVSSAHPAGQINFRKASSAYFGEVSSSGSHSRGTSSSKITWCAQLPSRIAPLNPRAQRKRLALPAPAVAVTLTDLAEIDYSKASLKESFIFREESRSGVRWLELSTLKIALYTNVPPCKRPSKARKRQGRLALPVPEVGGVMPAHPAEEIGATEVPSTDDMTLMEKRNSADAMSGPETVVPNFASKDHEQQLNEAEFSSGKKKKSRAARFRRWLRKFCCCSCHEGGKSSGPEETTF